ncbi:MAG: hypothetical protein AABZ23_07100, partial [Deltaproteobacteria bacterium]
DGRLKWVVDIKKLTVNEGLNHVLNTVLMAGTQITAWYVGLKGTGTVAGGDTLPSHAGWSELTPYTGNRPQWQGGTVANQSVDNSANKAVFSINATATVAGIMLCSAASGTTGTLLGAGDFSASRAVVSGDTLNVTVTCSAAAA